MASKAKLTGMDKVLKNLNAEVAKKQNASMRGLYSFGLLIKGRAQRRVPSEYGDLKRSAYVTKPEAGKNSITVGFDAAYAYYVHENLDAKWRGKPRRSKIGVYWGPKGEPRYLTNALDESKKDGLALIKAAAAGRSSKSGGLKR